MRHAVRQRLVGVQFCGTHVGRRLCVLEPGHEGHHSTRMPIRKLTREERLERDLAKAKAKCVQRGRHVRDLKERIARLEERRAWVERYPLFRLEYRTRGFARRLRRYYRFVVHRTVQRRSWKARTSA